MAVEEPGCHLEQMQDWMRLTLTRQRCWWRRDIPLDTQKVQVRSLGLLLAAAVARSAFYLLGLVWQLQTRETLR